MSEKRKGLGRGLGALIPNSIEAERPVDVFFPSREETPARTSGAKDPARSMRASAQSRKKPAGTQRTTVRDDNGAGGGSAGTKQADATDTEGAAPVRKASGTGRSVPKTQEKESGAARKISRDSSSAKKPTPSKTTPKGRGVARTSATRGASTQATSSGGGSGHATTAEKPATDVSRETSEVDGLLSVEGVYFGEIPIASIRPNPRQPRDVFDEDALEELAHSIREIGVLQPVVVRALGGEDPAYELVMGERRFRASQLAGKETIPAIVRQTQDDALLRDALLENLHRVDLNPLEEAAAYQQLLQDFACTQEELSERIGRSRPQISNTLRLLRLPPLVQRRVAASVLSSGHARALLALNDASQMEVLAQRIVAEGISVRATEEAVALMNRDGDTAPKRTVRKQSSPELDELAGRIGDRLDTRVSISMGKRKGKLSVEFASVEDLKRVLSELHLDV